uniref:Uncharacterized protein n=1 Tax=Nicotiana tabacum TaxID=4097 RepID=A0A1S4B107_TOBAC|nr:PREDICTED: uncharacterized protein LOC107803415 [Nicotiana tabacum]
MRMTSTGRPTSYLQYKRNQERIEETMLEEITQFRELTGNITNHISERSSPPPPATKKVHPDQGRDLIETTEVCPLLSAHNFCVSPTEIVYALEKLGPKVKWPPKMRSDLNTRKSDTLYEFHQERGHKTEDCIALRQEVVNMLQQGHLKELLSDKGRTNFSRGREHQGPPKSPSPARTINMIIEDDTFINSVKFTTTHKLKRSITCELCDELEESIIFGKSDADGLVFPHHDALIITLRILDTDVKLIMIDDGSGACIIHPRVLTQMKLDDKIVSRCITLTDFNNAVKRTSEKITLPVLVGGVTLETTFHIMDQDIIEYSAYKESNVHPANATALLQIERPPNKGRTKKKRHSNQQGRGRGMKRSGKASKIPT